MAAVWESLYPPSVSMEEEDVTASVEGETAPSTAQPLPTEPDNGFDDVRPGFPSLTYEYIAAKTKLLEEIVDALVKLYMENMMTPRNNKSFIITGYRNLHVDLLSAAEDPMAPQPINPRQWVGYIEFEYHYEGVSSPHGLPLGAWIPGGTHLYGFAVENRGYTFHMVNSSVLFPELS